MMQSCGNDRTIFFKACFTHLRSCALAGALLLILLPLSAHASSGGPSYKSGTIAAKGLVLGPNGKPIWVEFNAAGDEVGEIGEASGAPLEGATLMSANAYRACAAAYAALDPATVARRRIMTRGEYQAAAFTDTDGRAVPKPALQDDTFTIVVRAPDALYAGLSPVLLESPLGIQGTPYLIIGEFRGHL
jgi:hypothetical protein